MLPHIRASFEREARFVADASHELRTPTAVIKTEVEGALRDDDLSAATRASLLAALDECDRLTQLAPDLLVLARSDEAPYRCGAEVLSVCPLPAVVRDRIFGRAIEHGRTIDISAPADLRCCADGGRMHYYMTSPEGEKYYGYWEVEAVDEPNNFTFNDGFALDEEFTKNPDLPVGRNASPSPSRTAVPCHLRDHIRHRRDAAEGPRQGRRRGRPSAINQIDDLVPA
ncbi:MAG: histidine kinase dimerization/phospho-acceptor domain-containing protein [Lapillicoccus sp.]